MPDFVIPVDFQINTMGGTLDSPAGATVHTNASGQYNGFTAAEAPAEAVTAPEPAPAPVEEVPSGEAESVPAE